MRKDLGQAKFLGAAAQGHLEKSRFGMNKLQTIKSRKVFRVAYKRGERFASPLLVTYILKSRGRSNRIAAVASKKIGKATKRNRARRVIKEAYRLISNRLQFGNNFVFVARSCTAEAKMLDIQEEMLIHMGKARLLR